MDIQEYRAILANFPCGKRLPTALYVHRDEKLSLGEKMDRLLAKLMEAYAITPAFKVLKSWLDELKISFLSQG